MYILLRYIVQHKELPYKKRRCMQINNLVESLRNDINNIKNETQKSNNTQIQVYI